MERSWRGLACTRVPCFPLYEAGAPVGHNECVGALDALLAESIDFAGLFPPARLDLATAMEEFHRHRRHPQAGWLARFVIPLDRLDEALALSVARPGPWRFTVLAPASVPLDEAAAKLRRLEEASPDARLDSVELEPGQSPEMAGMAREAFGAERRIFLEIDWRREVEGMMEPARRAGCGVKLRTGGLKPEAVPPVPAVARLLMAAAHSDVAVKFTAGLHVPVPNDNAEVGARMHGFLNVFTAAMLSFTGRASQAELEELLSCAGYADFAFSEDALLARGFRIALDEIRRLRRTRVLSFGSCSFLEPVAHLRENGLLA